MKYQAITIMAMIVIGLIMMIQAQTAKKNCPFHKAGCDYGKMSQIANDMKKVFNNFLNDQGAPDLQEFSQNISSLGKRMEMEQRGCFEMLGLNFTQQITGFMPVKMGNGSFVNETEPVAFKLKTSACTVMNKTTPAWKNDPCCNQDLQAKMCCGIREVEAKRMTIKKWNPSVEQCCLNPEKTKKILNRMNRVMFDMSLSQTDQLKGKTFVTMNTVGQTLGHCIGSILFPQNCENDGDCPKSCNMDTRQCDPVERTKENMGMGINKCLIRKLSPQDYQLLASSIFKKVDPNNSVGNFVAKIFESPVCVHKYNPVKAMSATTKTACEAYEECNDGANTCGGSGGFCGMKCMNDTITGEPTTKCQVDTKLSQTDCPLKGLCAPFNTYMNKTDCEAKSYCTHPAHFNANETTCDKLFICVGYPYKDAKCMLKTDPKQNCPAGYSRNALLNNMCVDSIANDNEAACNAKTNATWVLPPTKPEECLQYQGCRSPSGSTYPMMNKDQCEKCKDGVHRWEVYFKPMKAQYKKGRFEGKTWWVPEKAKFKAGVWKNGTVVDFQKIAEPIFRVYSNLAKPMYKLVFSTMMDTMFTVFSTVACDCGTDPQDAKKCFKPPRFPAGGLSCVSGVADEFEDNFTKVKLKLNPNSCGDKNAGDAVTVYQHEVVFGGESRSIEEDQIAVDVKKEDKAICSIMGDGFSIEPAPEGGVTLCVPVDNTKFKVSSEKFTKASVATLSSDGTTYTYVNTEVMEDGETYCIPVKDTESYYAAMCDPASVTDSSASTRTFSMVMVLVISIMAFFF